MPVFWCLILWQEFRQMDKISGQRSRHCTGELEMSTRRKPVFSSYSMGRYESKSCVCDCYHQILDYRVSSLVWWRSKLSLAGELSSIFEFLLCVIASRRLEGEALLESSWFQIKGCNQHFPSAAQILYPFWVSRSIFCCSQINFLLVA